VLKAIQSAQFHIYPDPGQEALREAIAGFVGADSEQVVAGTGADDLLDILIRLVMPKAIAIPTPTFGMYRFLAKISRAKPIEVPRWPNFDLDVSPRSTPSRRAQGSLPDFAEQPDREPRQPWELRRSARSTPWSVDEVHRVRRGVRRFDDREPPESRGAADVQ
jgi:hypothetical protein